MNPLYKADVIAEIGCMIDLVFEKLSMALSVTTQEKYKNCEIGRVGRSMDKMRVTHDSSHFVCDKLSRLIDIIILQEEITVEYPLLDGEHEVGTLLQSFITSNNPPKFQ